MQTFSQRPAIGLIALLPICLSLTLTGCPDPKGKYDDFIERRTVVIESAEEMTGDGGSEGGAEERGETSSGTEAGSAGEEVSMITEIESGRFWLGLAPILDPVNPMAFVTEINFEIAEDGSMGRILSMSLDPMTCEDRSVSAEGLIDFTEGADFNMDGSFVVDLGERTVPGAANCISGSPILANIVMHGAITSSDTLCGTVTGELFQPFAFDLEGSTFAAIRLEEGMSTADLAIPSTCAELEALGADQ